MSFSPGPYKSPDVSVGNRDTPPPSLENRINEVVGMELIVSGLSRTSPRAAQQDLVRRIQEPDVLRDPNMPPLVISHGSGNIGEALDYVTVTLPTTLRDPPRDDVLDYARLVISQFEGIEARWKVGRGADKTRQLSFMNPAERNKDSDSKFEQDILKAFEDRSLDVQHHWSNRGRATFHFLKRESVSDIIDRPPIIGGRAINPIVPRYVQPEHCFEIAVTNVGAFPAAKSRLDSYVQEKMGRDALCDSRMEWDSNVYIARLSTPEESSTFLSLPFTCFDNENPSLRPNDPDFLYTLNSSGLPATMNNSNLRTQNYDSPVLRNQLDELTRQNTAISHTLDIALNQQNNLVNQLDNVRSQFFGMMGNMFALSSLQSQFMMSKTEVNSLEASLSTASLMLTIASSDQAQLNIQSHINDLRRKMSNAEHQVSTLTSSLNTMQQTFLQPYPQLAAIASPPAMGNASLNVPPPGSAQMTNVSSSANNPRNPPATTTPLSRKRTLDEFDPSGSTGDAEPMGPQIHGDHEHSDEEMGMLEEDQVGQQILPDVTDSALGMNMSHIFNPNPLHPPELSSFQH
ncbi:hypothetical protein C0992_002623 [Termitomyces sp. T32_za158]|nr:hypothetical protein C0992_002623 [Termitomyces sp. T32_za158]